MYYYFIQTIMKMDIVKEMKQQKGLIVAVIATGLIFGFIIGRAVKGKEAGEVVVTTMKTTTTTEGAKNSKDVGITTIVKNIGNASSVFASTKQNAGKTVFVDMVKLTADGWVVVREDVDGEMGNILGAQWLPKDTKSPATVELLRGTEPGKTYYVVLWNDDGDRMFGKDTDTPMLNNGKMITATFKAN